MVMNRMGHRMASRFAGAFAAATMGLSMFIAAPANAADTETATNYPDMMVAVFTNSDLDSTDSVYMSFNGVDFQKIAEPFTDATPNGDSMEATVSHKDGRNYGVWTMGCPSIIYKDGYFWMLASTAHSDDAGKLQMVVSYSKDLQHWSDPLFIGDRGTNGGQHITVEDAPNNGTPGQFDSIAADWAVAPNGDVYVVVSLGRYGGFHNDFENDTLTPYMVKLSGLSATTDPANDPKENRYNVTASTAKRINLPKAHGNYMDGSFYFEGNDAYLAIKRDGITNEIWKTPNTFPNPGDANSWELVNGNVVTGYEAPSLTKLNGKYYHYTDELADWHFPGGPYWRTGTNVQSSDSLSSGWSGTAQIQAKGADGRNYTVNKTGDAAVTPHIDGPRHGTVTAVTDPAAKATMMAARQAAGWGKWTGFWDVFDGTGTTGVTPHDSEILWTAEKGISKGYDDHSFGPERTVVRQDMAAFLYRLAGSPAFTPSAEDKAKFTDVNDGTPHANEIWWLANQGITTGFPNPDGKTVSFGGMRTVVRQDMAAFLHRYANKVNANPALDKSITFTDLASASHQEDVLWLGQSGVSTGWPNAGNKSYEFRGMNNVIRQDMAAFLQRMDTKVLSTAKQ